MKIAYFDCFSGISGDMTIGAFLDAGLEMAALSRELSKLKITGYRLRKSRASRGGISGTKFDCVVNKRSGHAHYQLKDIIARISGSRLSDRVKSIATGIFRNIGDVEYAIHGGAGSKKDVVLHELGAVDSIVDIVGTAIAIDNLGIDEVYSSAVRLGRHSTRCAHGVIPVPSPATIALLKGVPVTISDADAELVTPTGAGILKTLSKSFGPMPQATISSIGYGAGSRDLEGMPNMLRVLLGEMAPAFSQDNVTVIETNIDDMNPQTFEYLFERLFKVGALDAYTTPIQMKKSRPAFKLTVLSEPCRVKDIASVIFKETTTIGLRFYEAGRFKLSRKTIEVKTRYGAVLVKIGSGPDGIRTASPEYEECAAIARAKKVPLKAVYDEAKRLVKV